MLSRCEVCSWEKPRRSSLRRNDPAYPANLTRPSARNVSGPRVFEIRTFCQSCPSKTRSLHSLHTLLILTSSRRPPRSPIQGSREARAAVQLRSCCKISASSMQLSTTRLNTLSLTSFGSRASNKLRGSASSNISVVAEAAKFSVLPQFPILSSAG